MGTISEVRAAFEEGRGRWAGCSRPTHYGSLGLDLDGIPSSWAHEAAGRWRALAADEAAGEDVTASEEASLVDMALHLRLRGAVVCLGEGRDARFGVCGGPARRFCARRLAEEWECAADWLEEIEADARWAEEEAREALHSVEGGDWGHALRHARQACSIESGYEDSRPWGQLRRLIETAAR